MPNLSSLPENSTPFEKLLAALAQNQVDFAVAGGVAVALNGFVRATDDLDILVDDAPENVRKLLNCLTNWGEGWARELSPEDFQPREGFLRVMEDFALDVFTRLQGHSLNDFRPRLRHLYLGKARIAYLAPEDLIRLKDISWRDTDRMDAEVLKRILRRT